MKKTKYVAIPPKGCKPWLTAGKEYKILNIEEGGGTGKYGRTISLMSDDNELVHANEFHSEHLNGKNWTIKQIP